MRTLIFVPFVPLIAATAVTAAAQQVPTRTLSKPDAEYSEPFSQLVGVRELRDGRLVAADMRDKTLQVVDLAAKKATPIGREGSGPGEWMLPMRVLSMPGDSTLVWDIGNTRYLVVGPDAKPARVFSPIADAQGGDGLVTRGGGAGRGDGRGRGGAGAGGVVVGGRGGIQLGGGVGFVLTAARASDARGRTYSTGPSFAVTEAGIVFADSAPILRYDMWTRKTDTVAYVNLAKNNASGTANNSGGRQEFAIRIGGAGPFSPADDWTVLSDGTIVIARVADYHVEIVQPNGRRVVGKPVAYAPVRVGDAEKEEWRAAQRTGNRVAVSFGDGGRQVATPAAGTVQEPAAWPATKPPFLGANNLGATWATPNGEVWVMRTRGATDKTPTADVFDAQARLIGRIALPQGTRLVGFGAKGVYLVRVDDDDLQYLQRYAVQW